MAFSATDAALEGFRITRARPRAVLAWAAVQAVLVLALQAAAMAIAGPSLEAFATMSPLAALTPSPALLRLFPIAAEILVSNLVLLVLVYGVLYAAVNRAVLRPQAGGPGWLALGLEELRQVAVLGAYALTLLLVLLGGDQVLRLLEVLFSLALGAPGAVLVALVGGPGLLALVIWVGVRLSLAPAATFDRGRFTFFETWRLTQGRVWPLLGAYVLSWLLSFMVLVLVMLVATAVAAFVPGPGGGLAVQGGHAPPTATVISFANPVFLILLLFSGIAGGLSTAVVLAPATFAYRDLAAGGPKTGAFG
jgi:hypothetical protein